MDFTVLLDAPAKAVARIQIAKLGEFHDPRYGDFEITEENVDHWQRNLSKLPGGEALIDFEHRSERKPRDSKAAGWISGIDLDGDQVMADARWTPEGESAIKNEIYRFLSPTFGPARGADNVQLDDALPSVALTNKPVLGLPALTLASEERVSEAIDEDPALRFQTRALDGEYGDGTRALVLLDVSQAERDKAKQENNSLPDGSYPIRNTKQLGAAATLAASKHGNWQAAQKLIRRRAKELGVDVTTLAGFGDEKRQVAADSRAAMLNETILKTLDLPEDADEAAVEEKIAALKSTAEDAEKRARKMDKKPAKTLEQEAEAQGLKVLSAGDVTKLQHSAAAGVEALKLLSAERFDSAFKQAVKDRKATPAEEDSLKHFYTLDADATLELINSREPIMAEKPIGNPAIELDLTELSEADPQESAARGLHPDSVQLDAKIRKYMTDKGLDAGKYLSVLEAVNAGTVVL